MGKFVLVTLVFLVFQCFCADKVLVLQPIKARDIGASVPEPSGITYCEHNHHLYAISDTHSSHYIYEIDTNGRLINLYDLTAHFSNIEAVGCDSVNEEIYIAEESKRRITSFKLPSASHENTTAVLIELTSFVVDTGYEDGQSGIEGLTIDTKRDLVYVANEKHPRKIIQLNKDGEQINETEPDYCGDISDIFYDYSLDALWVLSDTSERVFVTDVTGAMVFDYWDLPVSNPEGVAIDNSQDPPLLIITTDPSSPHGTGYIPALFVFVKPNIGEGLTFHNASNLPTRHEVYCDGCDEVFAEVPKSSNHTLGILLLLGFTGVIVLIIVGTLGYLAYKRRRVAARKRFDINLDDSFTINTDSLDDL